MGLLDAEKQYFIMRTFFEWEMKLRLVFRIVNTDTNELIGVTSYSFLSSEKAVHIPSCAVRDDFN